MRASTLLVLTAYAGVAHAATVTLGHTQVVGADIPTLRQEFFAGIPYAEPPVGSLRLRPPILKRDLKVTSFKATTYGLACIQNAATLTAAMISEDCLTLNVLRPAGIPKNALLPVMVWIYGGGFIDGTSSTYNGSAIVAKAALRGTPVIYVSFNYRTGPLGFPQGEEALAQGSLNLGLKDQTVALQWVKSNIAAFGGDATKVTVFGESAGAISIAIHMLSPNFAQLARAAILESGSWGTTLTNTADVRQRDWQSFVQAIPACIARAESRSFECLQNTILNSSVLARATAIAAAQPNELYPFVPTYDDGVGGVYRAPGSIILASGDWAAIPFVTGCNRDEGTAFTSPRIGANGSEAALLSNFTPSLIPFLGQQLLQYDTQELLELYPDNPSLGAPFGTGNDTFGLNPEFKRSAALTTDIGFHSQRRLFQKFAAAEGVKSYGYHFIDPAAAPSPMYGVTHGTEVPYVYGSCNTSSQACQVMIDYWVSFATSLNPNDGKGTPRPTWASYSNTSPTVLQLNGTNTTNVPDTYRQAQIAFLNRNALVFHQRSSV